jgi:limonene-1,2-epoxide hydrolase
MTTQSITSTTADTGAPKSPQEVVEAFISALERLDYDAALALVADDVRWVNYPLTTSRNKKQFEKVLRGMFKNATRFEVQYLDIHERSDGVVYTDRIDIFEGGGFSMDLPVQGEFRVRDGLVVEWVDRFSWLKLTRDMATSLPSIVQHRLRG